MSRPPSSAAFSGKMTADTVVTRPVFGPGQTAVSLRAVNDQAITTVARPVRPPCDVTGEADSQAVTVRLYAVGGPNDPTEVGITAVSLAPVGVEEVGFGQTSVSLARVSFGISDDPAVTAAFRPVFRPVAPATPTTMALSRGETCRSSSIPEVVRPGFLGGPIFGMVLAWGAILLLGLAYAG